MNFENLIGRHVHFIGIGGVSMSGIARCFAMNGVIVQGSDSALQDSKYTDGFQKLGIKLFETHSEANITSDVSLIVKTSTVSNDNHEILKARELGIKIIERFEALELIIAKFNLRIGISGSSGKTTTTALMWQALYGTTGIMPSCVIGTILNETNTSVFMNNKSNICVVEADESDGSFAEMNFNVAVITDIDADHLDHHKYEGSRDKLIEYFCMFISKTLACGGLVIYNADCQTTRSVMSAFLVDFHGRVFAYSGLNKIINISSPLKGDCFIEEVINLTNGISFACGGVVKMKDVIIPIIGTINAFNALPGLIVSKVLLQNESPHIFKNFKGVNKRAEIVGSKNNITIIDDYAHSPKKIRTFISSFASYCRDINTKFVIICEPHKYTRVESLYEEYLTCFDECDYLLMMPIFGVQGRVVANDISSENLVIDITNRWNDINKRSFFIKSLKFNKDILDDKTFFFTKEFFNEEHKVFYVFLGAGFSSKYAHLLWQKIS